MTKDDKGLLTFIAVAMVFVLGLNIVLMMGINDIEKESPELDVKVMSDSIATQVIESLPKEEKQEPSVTENSAETPAVIEDYPYMLTKSEYEEDAIEAKAEEMALEEIKSNDFYDAVYDALLAYNISIDDEDDITEIKVMDLDVDADIEDKNASVEMDIKVYFYIDGDDEETFRARLEEFTIEIEYLDFDDDFEDAEVYLGDIEVKKLYE